MWRTVLSLAFLAGVLLPATKPLLGQGGVFERRPPAQKAMLVTIATGAEARQFVEMKSRFDKRFARHRVKAAGRLAGKGWKAANVFAVVTMQDDAGAGGPRAVALRIWERLVPRLAAQTAYTNGEGPFDGVVIYESWNDGDDTTWEGMSYFENYDTGQAFSAASQEWTGADYERVFWVEAGAYDPPGRDPFPMLARWLPRGAGTSQRLLLTGMAGDDGAGRCMLSAVDASFSPDVVVSGPSPSAMQDPSTPTSCPCPRSGGEEPIASCALKIGITRSWVWCGSVFAGCRWAGSLWKACGIGCAARAASETLTEGYRWHRDCVRR